MGPALPRGIEPEMALRFPNRPGEFICEIILTRRGQPTPKSQPAPLQFRTVFVSAPSADACQFSAVGQAFLSAGSGDFPVPSSILETVLESTVNPQAGKPALVAADGGAE